MSLNRLIYYSAIIGGWAAFFGWLVSAGMIRLQGPVGVALTAALLAARSARD